MNNPTNHGRFCASGDSSAYITNTHLVITNHAGRVEYPLSSIQRVVEIDLPGGRRAVAINLRQKVETHPGLNFDTAGEAARFANALLDAIDALKTEEGISSRLGAGMVVAIYQRPITREEFEGQAELLQKSPGEMEEGLQRWLVCFDGERKAFWRTVPADEPDQHTLHLEE